MNTVLLLIVHDKDAKLLSLYLRERYVCVGLQLNTGQ